MKLSEKLVYLRKEKRLSQYDVASALNVSRQAISRWESGRSTPSTDNLKCLSVLFDVSVDFLLYEEMEQLDRKEVVANEDQTDGKRWLTKKVAISLLILLLVVMAFMLTIYFVRESKITSIQEMEKEVGQDSLGTVFDIVW